MPTQTGGGSVGQSIRYVDPLAPEQTAPAGSDLLIENQRGLIARPAIGGGTRKRRGGFYPSIMKGVMNAGMITGPLVAMTARRMMSRKTRKGGGKKAILWQRNKNEAKAILEHYGKPSAGNAQAYAIARRRGTEAADKYLEDYKKRKQEKAERNEAVRLAKQKAKNEKKAKKAAEKEAAKATKKAAKAAEKAAKKANKTKKEKKPKAAKAEKAPKANEMNAAWMTLIKEAEKKLEEYNRPTKKNKQALASLMKEGKNIETFINNYRTRVAKKAIRAAAKKEKTNAVVVAVKEKTPEAAVVVAVKEKTPEPPKAEKSKAEPSNKSKQYFQNLRNARTFLAEHGNPTGPNMAAYIRMKRKGEDISTWLNNFKTRRPLKTAAPKKEEAPKTTGLVVTTAAVPTTLKPKKANTTAKAKKTTTTTTTTAKAKKRNAANKTAKANKPKAEPSNKSKQYFQNLRNARTALSEVGYPGGPNMSAYIKLKRAGNEKALSEWMENFKTRRPKTLATAKKGKTKTTTTAAAASSAAPRKPLTAVKEENETNNNSNNENEMQGYEENFEPEPENE